MPSGKLFPGFFTSSASDATFVNPPKEIKTKLAVANNGAIPLLKNGVKFAGLITLVPRIV